MNPPAFETLLLAVDWLAGAPGLRVLVLTGAGQTFCADGVGKT